jgi:hypothetical protein
MGALGPLFSTPPGWRLFVAQAQAGRENIMDTQWSELGFAGALAQSRSIQSLARVLKLYAQKYPGECQLIFKNGPDGGIEIDFGSSDAGAATGLEDFMRYLQQTDDLMLLESIIENLRDRRADEALIDSLIDEAKDLVGVLYPEALILEEGRDG